MAHLAFTVIPYITGLNGLWEVDGGVAVNCIQDIGFAYPMICIRINFKADSDPTFYLNADPVRSSGSKPMRIRILVRLCRHLKNFYMTYILYVGNRS